MTRMTGRYFHPLDPAAPYGPDEPPTVRVGTCCQCGAPIDAHEVTVPDKWDPEAYDVKLYPIECDCYDLELHDDRPGGF